MWNFSGKFSTVRQKRNDCPESGAGDGENHAIVTAMKLPAVAITLALIPIQLPAAAIA